MRNTQLSALFFIALIVGSQGTHVKSGLSRIEESQILGHFKSMSDSNLGQQLLQMFQLQLLELEAPIPYTAEEVRINEIRVEQGKQPLPQREDDKLGVDHLDEEKELTEEEKKKVAAEVTATVDASAAGEQPDSVVDKREKARAKADPKQTAVSRMVTIMKDIQGNLHEDLDILTDEFDGFEKNCTSRVPSIKLQVKGKAHKISEYQVTIPPLESKIDQQNLEITDKQDEIDFSEANLKSITAHDVAKQAEYEKSRKEHTDLIAILQEAKSKVGELLKGSSFLQMSTMSSPTVEKLIKDTQSTIHKIKSDHHKIFYSLVMAQLSKPGIQADQGAVQTIVDILDSIIEAETEAMSQEHQLNIKRHNRFLDRKSQNDDMITKAGITKAQLEAGKLAYGTRLTQLKQDQTDAEDSKVILLSQIAAIVKGCDNQLKNLTKRIENFGDILELIRQIMVLLEKSSLAYVKATVEEVLNGDFYAMHGGNGPKGKHTNQGQDKRAIPDEEEKVKY